MNRALPFVVLRLAYLHSCPLLLQGKRRAGVTLAPAAGHTFDKFLLSDVPDLQGNIELATQFDRQPDVFARQLQRETHSVKVAFEYDFLHDVIQHQSLPDSSTSNRLS